MTSHSTWDSYLWRREQLVVYVQWICSIPSPTQFRSLEFICVSSACIYRVSRLCTNPDFVSGISDRWTSAQADINKHMGPLVVHSATLPALSPKGNVKLPIRSFNMSKFQIWGKTVKSGQSSNKCLWQSLEYDEKIYGTVKEMKPRKIRYST